jgi:hypothetical protein
MCADAIDQCDADAVNDRKKASAYRAPKKAELKKKPSSKEARLEVLATCGRHNHLPREITERSRHWRRGTNA